MARTAAFDVLVRVTVLAKDRQNARRIVSRWLPNPDEQDSPNSPVDSWSLLTKSRVIGVDANPQRDIVTWQAQERS